MHSPPFFSMATVAKLSVQIGADTGDFDKKLNTASSQMQSWGQKLSSVGQSLSLGITAPLVLLGKQITEIGFSYERAMNTFQAVTKASTGEMAAAAAMAEKLGADMTLPATSAADAALAMTELAKGGFTAQQAMDAARGALQLAAAAQVSEAQAAEITANALNTFGLAASESTRVADLLAAASNASSAEITDVAQAMQQAGAGAAALHIPIEDLTTAIAEMANQGIKGSDAGTSLKTFMVALEPHTKAAAAAMRELGIHAYDSSGAFVGLQTIIQQAQPALAKMTDQQRAHAIQAAFGTDAMRAANIVLGGGVEKFTAMSSAVNQSGAASELAAAKTKGLSGAWDGFLSQLETLGLKVFKEASGGLEGLVRSIAGAVEGLGKLDSTVIKAGLAFATVAASSGPIALIGGKLLALGPQGAIVAAVVAGIGAIAAAYTTKFASMNQTLDAFAASMSRAFGGKSKAELGAWADAMASLGIIAANALDILLTGLAQVSNVIGGVVRANFAVMRLDSASAFRAIKEGYDGIAEAGEKFNQRMEKNGKEFAIVQKGGAKALMEYLRVINSEGGADSGNAYFTGYKAADPFGHIKQFSGVEMNSLTGYLRSTGITAGAALGSGLKQGAHDATHQSPFFIIHWLQDAAKYAQNESPSSFASAGRGMGEKLKEGFQSALGNINDWLGRTIGGTGTISDTVFDIILRKFPKVAEELQKQGRDFHEVNQAIELYSAVMNTASGRNSEYASKVNNALGSLLQFDKAMREYGIPEVANFNSKIGETIIITQAMGEAIRDAVGSLVTDTLQAPGKALKEQILLWANSGKAATDWGKTMSEAVRKAKDDIRQSLGEGIGGILIALADKFHWHLDKVKGWAGDVSNLIGTMPGKFGDAARKVASTLNQWLSFGNSVLSILNRVFGQGVPSSMDGLLSSIVNIFKGDKATNQVGAALGGLVKNATQSATQSATVAGQTAGGAVSGGVASGITAGTSGAVSAIGSLFSALTGAINTFASTFHDDSKAVRFAGGFLLGGPVGGILAAIFGGPSEFEKQKRALQLDQMKANIASVYEDIKSKMVDEMAKLFDLLENISTRTDTPRKAIRRFVNQAFLLLEEFVEASKELAPKGLEAAKSVTESFGGSFELMMGAVDLTKAIKGMEEASTADVAALRNSTTKLLSGIFAVMDEVELSAAKQSGKKSDRLKPVLDFITAIPNAIKAVIETPEVSNEQLDKAFDSSKRFIDRFVVLSESLIGYALNKTSKAAGQLTGVFDTGKSMFEFLKVFTDYTPLPEGVFDSIRSDFDEVTGWLDTTESLASSWKSKAESIQGFIQDMLASLGSTFAALRGVGYGSASGITIGGGQASFGGVSYVPAPKGASSQTAIRKETSIQINFYGHVADKQAVKDFVMEAFVEARQRGGSY